MRRLLGGVAAFVTLMAVGLVTAPATVAGAASPTPSPIYNSIESPLPPNLPSLGYEATSASEVGNQISFSSGSARVLQSVVVTMSSWGCETGSWSNDDCSTTPGDTFSEPVTLNLYDVGADGTSVGAKFATVTQTFNIPYRPSADPNYTTDCAADAAAESEPVSDFDGTWYDSADGHCYNGLDDNITFNLANVTVPNTLIYGIAYNTSDYGADPYGDGTPCHATEAGCPYDSLNLALSNDPADVSVGSDPQQGTIYWNTSYAGFYCDGGAAGVGTFRIDSPGYPTCWNEGGTDSGPAPYYVPSVQFNVSASSTTTAPAHSTIELGQSNTDSATETGNSSVGSPTGTVQFYECGPTPSPTPCTSTSNPVGGPTGLTAGANDTSTAGSVSFTPTSTGYWCFAGVYSGDSNYNASSDTSTDECFDVTPAPPGAPTGLTTRAGNGKVTVSWNAPASNGGSTITGYTVTASPGGKTCTTSSLSCIETGLVNGTSYTFTVTARNVVGIGTHSTPSSPRIPTGPVTISPFGSRSAALTPSLTSQVANLASIIKTDGFTDASITGYSEPPASLGIDRASSVASSLETALLNLHVHGVAFTEFYGGSMPPPNSLLNRRVVVSLSY